MAITGMHIPSDPHLMRWMLFVDGENFTIRAQRFAKRRDFTLTTGPCYEPDTFVWFPDWKATGALTNTEDVSHRVQPNAIRAHYYTSVRGDDQKQRRVREALSDLGKISELVFENISDVIRLIRKREEETIKKVVEREDLIDRLVRDARARHLERHYKRLCAPEAGPIFIDILIHLERISDHCENIAEHIQDIEESV